MAKYDVDVQGITYEVDAPDPNTAWKWAVYTHKQKSEPKRTDRTWGEAATDVPASLVSGLGSLVQLPGQLYGLATGNFEKTGSLGLGEKIQKYGEEMKSDPLKAMEEARAKKIQEAEKTGQLSAFGTAFSETVKSPTLLASFLLEQVPQLIPALISGGGTAALTAAGLSAKEAATLVSSGMAKEAAEIAAKKAVAARAGAAGVAAAKGTGAIQQGADIGAGVYESAYKEMIDRNVPEAEAAQKALNLARASGASGAIISLLAQKLPGASTLEETFAGVPGKSGRLMGGARGALGEAASEVVEETGGRFSQNLAMREVNPEQSLTEGLGQAAGMAAVGGVGMGGVSGLAQKPASIDKKLPDEKPPSDKVPNVEPPVRPPQAPTAKVTLTQEDLDALQNYTQGLPDTAGDVFQRLQNRDRATPASIQQMQNISSNPDYDRLKTSADLGSGAPVVISDIDIPANQMGRVDIVTGSDGRKIPVQYAVIDADQLLTSHTADGRTNEDYGNVSTSGIRAVAGNGRIAGLQAAYGLDTAGDYRTAMSYDNQHGIDQGAILDMGKPVLVRIMPKSFITPDIGDVSNVAGQLRLNPVEAAKNDLNRFDLGGLSFNEDGSINTQSLIQFVRGMPKEEQGELMDKNGMPNTTAIDRLNNAIFYKAYGSESLIDLYAQAADPEAKLILQGMARAASRVAKLEGAGEYDIRKNIIEAAELAVNAKRSGLKLQDIVKQGNLGMDPNTMAVLSMFADNARSGKRMGELIGNLADAAYEQSQAGEDMFGQKPKLPVEEIFKTLQGEEGGPDLFTQEPPKEEPREESKIFESKKSSQQIEKEVDGMDIGQVCDWLVDNAPNSVAKYIAQKIGDRIKDMVSVGYPITFEVVKGKKGMQGAYGVSIFKMTGKNLSTDVKVNGNDVVSKRSGRSLVGTTYSILLHELLHAATQPQTYTLGKYASKYMDKQDLSLIFQELTPLLNKIRRAARMELSSPNPHPFLVKYKASLLATKASDQVHLQNVSELISYGLTENDFQDWLSTVNVGKGETAMTKLVEFFRKLLNIEPKYKSALEELARITDTELNTPIGELQQKIKSAGFEFGTKAPTTKTTPPSAPATPQKANKPPVLTAPAGFKIPAGRNEQVVLAARELKAGNITKKQYDEYVDYYAPIAEVLGDKLESPIDAGLMEEILVNRIPQKKDPKFVNAPIADGKRVGLRMDIPALEWGKKNGVNGSVVSIHEGKPATNATQGKNISYKPAGALKNVEFAIRSEEKAFNVAQAVAGKAGQKAPQQTIEGNWVNMTPEEIFKSVKEKLNDPEWSQVSLDPLRHSYFYDRKTKQPVVSADEVLQVGRFVLAKNVKYAKREEFLYSKERNEPYVTQDEIRDMQYKAYDELSKTEEFKKSQQRIKDAQEESNKRFNAVVDESVRLLKENPQFKNALGDLSESVIYNIAMAYRGVAEKNVPALKLSEHDAIVAQNKLIENFYKRKNIPEPRQFSNQANQDRDYYSDPRFKKWFRESKAVNKNGKPFVAFHTTDKNFGIFNVGQNIKERTNNPNYTGKLGSWFTAPSLYGREYEAGNAENAVSFSEGKEGDNTMLVHLSIQNPMEYDGFEELQDERDSYPSVEKFKQALIEDGYDGVVVRNSMTDGNVDRDDWVAFYPTQIKSAISNTGEFSVDREEIDRSLVDDIKTKVSTALQKRPPLKPESFEGVPDDFMNAANPVYAPQKKTIIDRINGMRDNFWRKLAQGMADQFRTIREYSPEAYMKARLSKSVDGALEGIMMYGEVFNDGGALNIKPNTKGLIEVLKPLGNEVDRFNMWKALTRESQLPVDKRSRFINEQGKDVMPKLVAERDKLIEGDLNGKPRKQLYEQVRKDMQKLNESVLKVALDMGLIDSTANMIERIRDQISFIESKENLSDNAKEKQIQELEDKIADLKKNPIGYERFVNDINYIPFYREMEDGDIDAVMTASSLTNQHFSKALKGGESPFSDLMENTLRNWSHILSSSMKAQAAKATIDAAIPLGGAEPNLKQQFVMVDGLVNVITRKKDEDGNTYESAEVYKDGKIEPWMTTPASGKSGKSSVKIMVDGSPAYYNILDPMLLDSISSIGYLGPKSKFLDVARDFKNMLQFGVTISPAFKVRNLIRDSIQAMAVSDLKKNPFANIADGWASSDKNNPAHISALAGGAVFTFGTHVEGDQAKLVKRLVEMGVKPEHILDTPDKIKKGLQIAWDKYQDWGNKSESANRMALYNQMVDKGMSHLEASYYARDLLDFSMSGSWPAFRQVCQVVPFLNARVQGLYKLGRDGIMPTSRVFYNTITGQPIEQTDKQKAESFSIVTSAVCLASLALYFAFKDDEEFKKRDEWDRDNFWWFKLPGMDYALRVPKPFEIGAFGTIAERVAEQIFDEGAEGKQFQKSMGRMVTDTFAVNLPQFVKPLVDLYANKDSFTGAPIESAGMERLSKQERSADTTSPLAKVLGGISSIAGEGLSPVQMDYAIKAYFGWLGSAIAETSHYAVMPFKDGSYPDTKMIDKLSVGLVKSLPSNQSKYATAFYDSNKEISQAFADMRHYAEIGDADKVRQILEEKGDKIALAKFYDKTAKNMAKIRQHISVVTNDTNMDGASKREEIDRMKELISMLAQQAEDARKSMKQ
jgi:hypothetical protein